MGELEPISIVTPSLFPANKVLGGFTTRHGGVSKPPFDSLNLGYGTGDERTSVSENHERLYRFLGIGAENAAFMDQVHGNSVTVVGSGGTAPASDGLVTSAKGVLLCVRTADCIPLLLYDPVHSAAGAVHCGWRPLVSGIAGKAVALMNGLYGSVPADILAALGPSAGPCCYEIGNDVADLLDTDSTVERNGSIFGDLRAELTGRLAAAGLRPESIETSPDCTVCHEADYFSHRRDGERAGRMAGFILIR